MSCVCFTETSPTFLDSALCNTRDLPPGGEVQPPKLRRPRQRGEPEASRRFPYTIAACPPPLTASCGIRVWLRPLPRHLGGMNPQGFLTPQRRKVASAPLSDKRGACCPRCGKGCHPLHAKEGWPPTTRDRWKAREVSLLYITR